MSASVIEVEQVGKLYRIGEKEKQAKTFLEAVKNIVVSPFRNYRQISGLSDLKAEQTTAFWALRDINFTVKKGEVLGIIGRNGAGKSTLLKILSRIADPTEGHVKIKGKVSSLLEVGTGFHPELTGRDNIYMNGTILGMTRKEIEAKFDEIVDFSGVSRHIDTPVKFYSSGMKVRLGFAVAAHLDPEILIIDEVLAVGDVEFQKKCLGKIHEVSGGEGRTVLFVSHSMPSIKNLCTRCICLDAGKISFSGNTSDAIDHYLASGLDVTQTGIIPLDMRRDFGTGEAKFTRVQLLNQKAESHKDFYYGEVIKAVVNFEVFDELPNYCLSIMVGTLDGQRIVYSEVSSDRNTGVPSNLTRGLHSLEVDLSTKLLPGSYSIYLGLSLIDGRTIDWIERVYDFHVLKTGYHKNQNYRWDESHGFVLNEGNWNIIITNNNS